MTNLLSNAMNKTMGLILPIRTSKQCLIITLILISFCQITTAQQRLGLANNNYGGVTTLMSNPADIAGSRYKTYIGFAQMDFHLTNNYFKLSGLNVDNLDSVSILKKNGDYLSAGFDVASLSWIQSINPKMAFGLSSRARGAFQGVGITPNLYKTLGIGKDSNSVIKGGGFNINAQIFSELAASYAQTLVDNKDYGFKMGVTIKRLSGAFATGMTLSQLDAQHTTVAGVEKYKISNGQLNIAYIGTGDLNDATNFSPSNLFGGGGKGWGFDLGATYEHRTGNFTNDYGTTPYLFRVGVSVTDVGNIKYSGSNVRYYSKNLKNVNFNISDTTDLASSNDILEAAGIKKDSFAKSFTAQIPTMLRVNADVRITDLFFVSLNLGHSLANRYQLGTQYASFVAVTPRLETRYFDVSLPLALMNNYKTFGVGFGVRVGFVTFGMDNFTGFVGSASGLNGHAGLNIGIGRQKSTQDLAEKEKEKEKEAEVVEAKKESQEKSKKKANKAPKQDPLSNEPTKAPAVVAAPKSVMKPEEKAKDIPESTPPQDAIAAKPTAPKIKEKAQQMPVKAPIKAAISPKPTVPTTSAKPTEMPSKAPATFVTAPPKSTAPTTTAKPTEMPSKTSAQVATAPKPTVPTTTAKPKELPAKMPTAAATVPKPVVVEKPANVNISPVGSGKMGECIEFFPNKAAITGSSALCLKEISKFLIANKSIKLNITGSVLSTEKAADGAALKLERAKTVRNFLIQSGVEAARLAVKTGDSADAPIILSAQ